MLTECPSCKHQYDVANLLPGCKLHCRCGGLVTVPEPVVHELKPVHCFSCGGGISEGDASCGYCGSQLSLQERRLGQTCPSCFCRTLEDSKFCSSCGVAINPERVDVTPIDKDCPRCQGDLVRCGLGSFVECSKCGGVWLEESSFEDFVERGDESSIATLIGAGGIDEEKKEAMAAAQENTVRYVPCPECGELMNRKNFAGCSGVVIDWCRGHGYWFDPFELEKILEFVRTGGMDKARRMQIDRAKREKERAEWAATMAGAGRIQPGAGMIGGSGASFPMDEPEMDLLKVLGGFVKGLFRSVR